MYLVYRLFLFKVGLELCNWCKAVTRQVISLKWSGMEVAHVLRTNIILKDEINVWSISKRRLFFFFLVKCEGLFLLFRRHWRYLKVASPGLSIPDSSISATSNSLFFLSRPFLYWTTSAKIILLVCFAVLPLLYSEPIFSSESLLKYHRAILSDRALSWQVAALYILFPLFPGPFVPPKETILL